MRLQKCTGTYARQSSLIELDLAEMNDFKSHPGGACPRGHPGACRHTEACLYIGWYTQVFPKFFIKFFVRDLSEVLRTRCSLFRQGITTKNHTTISSISNGVYPKKRDIRRESTGATGGWPYVSLSSLVLSTYMSLMGYRRMLVASP